MPERAERWYRQVEARAEWTDRVHGTRDHMVVTTEELLDGGYDEHVRGVLEMLTARGISEEMDDLQVDIAVTLHDDFAEPAITYEALPRCERPVWTTPTYAMRCGDCAGCREAARAEDGLARRRELASQAVRAETLAVRIAWALTRNAEFYPETDDEILAKIAVHVDGHPYAVTGKGADENEARCRLRDAIVDLFDERKGGAAS